MQIILYVTTYIIGILLGSFFTLATYRLPLKQDITHTRSYCPECNHKLNFWDLIPVLSYIFLGGKCRYCNKKISPRYIIIELTSGLIYLLFAISLKIDIYSLNLITIGLIIVGTIFICTLFILGGISKENHKIPKNLIITNIVSLIIYITYLYIFCLNVHRYIIYISIAMSLTVTLIYKFILKKQMHTVAIQTFSLIIFWIILNFIMI